MNGEAISTSPKATIGDCMTFIGRPSSKLGWELRYIVYWVHLEVSDSQKLLRLLDDQHPGSGSKH